MRPWTNSYEYGSTGANSSPITALSVIYRN